MSTRTIQSEGEDETVHAGERLAETVRAGDLILLYGDLGAGKTAFVRGLARGLGIDPGDVSSPTFTLVQEYRSPGAILMHVDLYRLNPVEVDDLGLDELLSSGAAVAIEWPDRWRDRPAHAYEVRIEHAGGDRRVISVSGPAA